MKKFRRSPLTYACYTVAAVFAVYFCVTVVSTITTINNYYAGYGMTAGFTETLGYVIQAGAVPLISALATLMIGCIHDEVRKLNPAYYATDEELAAAREAKKQAREEAKAAKAAANETGEEEFELEPDTSETGKVEFSAEVAQPETTDAAEAAVETEEVPKPDDAAEAESEAEPEA